MIFTERSRAWHAPAHCTADADTDTDSDSGADTDTNTAGGVLLCHGISGTPQSLRPWGEHLAARGWDVRIPLLPGHGTRWQDLGRVRWEQWVDALRVEADDLLRRHGSVSIGGLSMGGALALALAEDRRIGPQVDALVLVNPAVRLDLPSRLALPVLRHVVPSIPGIASDIALPGACEEAYDRLSVRGADQLRRLQAHVRRHLADVRCPVLVATSPSDHVVDPRSSDLVAAGVRGRVSRLALNRSHHVATLDHDATLIQDRSEEFLARHRGSSRL